MIATLSHHEIPVTKDDPRFMFSVPCQFYGLLDKLASNRLVFMVGPASSGKTTLLEKGLVDALEQGQLVGGGTNWRFLSVGLRKNPLMDLIGSFLRAFPDAGGSPGIAHQMEALILRDRAALRNWFLRTLPSETSLLITIDDLDFALRKISMHKVVQIIEQLSDLTHLSGRFYVVFAAGIDVLSFCARNHKLTELVNTSLCFLPYPDASQIQQTIESSFRRLGHDVRSDDIADFALEIAAGERPWAQYESAVPKFWLQHRCTSVHHGVVDGVCPCE